jgi:hypothetical protein
MRNGGAGDENELHERAVSITTGFILNIGVATVAVSIIMFSLQGVFTDVRDDSQETQLRVVGERLVWELEKADRMAHLHDSEGAVYFESADLDGSYSISITDNNVTLSGDNSRVTLGHGVESGVDGTVELAGGQEHRIEYEPGDELEVE